MDFRTTSGGLVSERAFACGASEVDKAVSSVVALLMGASFDAGAVPFATISVEVLAWGAVICGIDAVASSAVGLTEGAFGLSAITLTGGEGSPASLGLKVGWSACD